MKYIYIFVTLFVIAIIGQWIISSHGETARNTPPPLPQVARAYTLYSNDPNTDLYKSPREYRLVSKSHDRVVLSCDESKTNGFSIKIWNNFKGYMEFNPLTGQGRWTGEEGSDYQTALVKLTPNSYAGFEIEFLYDKSGNRRTAELAPVR